MNRIGKERGWSPTSRARFDAQNGPTGAYRIGAPEEVAEKILRHSEALGGISGFTFQMDNAGLPHEQLLQSFELIGSKVAPLAKEETDHESVNPTRIVPIGPDFYLNAPHHRGQP